MKRCSTTLVISELQIETTVRYHLTLISRATIKKPRKLCINEGGEKLEHLGTVAGTAKCCDLHGK